MLNVINVDSEQTRNKFVLLNKPKFYYLNHVEEITKTPIKLTHLASEVIDSGLKNCQSIEKHLVH